MGSKVRLNEWHFVENCMKAIRENGKAIYSIVRRDRHPDFTFSGILRDRNGNVYEITDQESKDLFDTLIRIHQFTVEEDHTHTELIISTDEDN